MRGITALLPLLCLAHSVTAASYTVESRWGHSAVFLPQPPTLLIQGGRVDPNNQYSYGSAPTSPDTIILPLTTSFPASTPPFNLLTPIAAGPAQAWHCLATLGQTNDRWQILSFGGDIGWDQASSNIADSSWLIDIDPATGWVNYTHQPTDWAGQPRRRILHSCAGPVGGGTVYISGGRAVDGSTDYSQVYAFSPATNTFSQLPSLPEPVSHHSSVLLGNGTLLVFTGISSNTNQLLPSNLLYTLDTTKEGAAWLAITGPENTMKPRVGASATLMADGKVFMYGGADVGLTEAYKEGWILDPASLQWRLSVEPVDGGMFDLSAVAAGGQIIAVGGNNAGVPGSPNVVIIQPDSAGSEGVVPTFSWPSQTTLSPTQAENGIPPAATGTSLPAPEPSRYEAGGGHRAGHVPRPEDTTTGGSGTHADSEASPPTASAGPTSPVEGNEKADNNTTMIIVGVLLGIALIISMMAVMWCTIKKRGKEKPARPYKEKGEGNARLMDEEALGDLVPPPPTVPRHKAISFAALGHGLARAVDAVRKVSNGEDDGYRTLRNEAAPHRRSTKRNFGRGIRIVRNSEDSMPLPPQVRGISSRNMLDGEDGDGPLVPTRIIHEDDLGTSRLTWATALTLLGADSSTSDTPTQYYDLGTSPPPMKLRSSLRQPQSQPILAPHIIASYDTARYTSSTMSDFTHSRQAIALGIQRREEQMRRLAQPTVNRMSAQSLGVISSASSSQEQSLQEVDTAVIGSALQARTSLAQLFERPPASQHAMLSASPTSGMATVSPNSVMAATPHSVQATLSPASGMATGSPSSGMRSFDDALDSQPHFNTLSNNTLGLSRQTNLTAESFGRWPLQSSSDTSSTNDSLARPPHIELESSPSMVSLPSVHSMRDMLVFKREVSVNSSEAVIETASQLRVVGLEDAQSSASSFVTAREVSSERPSLDEEGVWDGAVETGGLLSGLADTLGNGLDLRRPAPGPEYQKPLPRTPTSVNDPIGIDFGPTLAAADGLTSPVIDRPSSPDSRSTPRPSSVAASGPAAAAQDRLRDLGSPSSPNPLSKRPTSLALASREEEDNDILPVLKRFTMPSGIPPNIPPNIPSSTVTPTPSPKRNTPRRPVREIAASINKRNASVQLDLDRPNISPSVQHETARRPSLHLANP